MLASATVKLFLVEGSATSLRTAELSNWTGKAVAAPRSKLSELLRRSEAEKAGVYFLSGINPETGKERVYIGEAEVIKKRIFHHNDREFWKTIVFFVSENASLTKSHIKYLEGKLIEKARLLSRVELENSQASGSHLPESDMADMDVFLSKMEQLLPILGLNFLKPVLRNEQNCPGEKLLYCQIKGLKASGRQTDTGFVVLKGSEAVLNLRKSTNKYPFAKNQRATLIEEGALLSQKDKFVFDQDVEFSSPSAAAAVVQGGQANGLTSWKDSTGKTLKKIEAEEIEQVEKENKR